MLTDFVTLPDDIGKPVAVAVSAKETQLIIATYDAGSPKEYKGFFCDCGSDEQGGDRPSECDGKMCRG